MDRAEPVGVNTQSFGETPVKTDQSHLESINVKKGPQLCYPTKKAQTGVSIINEADTM